MRYLDGGSTDRAFYPALFHTSNQLRHEALPVFTNSDFRHALPCENHADRMEDLTRWAKLVDNYDLRQIRSFTFTYDPHPDFCLELHVTITYTRAPGLRVSLTGEY